MFRTLVSILVSFAILALAVSASAYDSYRTFGADASCADCHNGFVGRGPLHGLHVGSQNMTGTCLLCHTSVGDIPRTWTSGAAGGQGCRGCHGRDDGSALGWGAGLRAHHLAAGAPADKNGQFCADCHTNDATPEGENVLPLYYSRVDVNVKDPCVSTDAGGEDYSGDGQGLDNDGDLAYDESDTDCGATGTGPLSGSTHLAMSIAPNPFSTQGTFVSYWNAQGGVLIDLYDLAGRRVSSRSMIGGTGEGILHVQATDDSGVPLASGVYLLSIRSGDASVTRRIALIR